MVPKKIVCTRKEDRIIFGVVSFPVDIRLVLTSWPKLLGAGWDRNSNLDQLYLTSVADHEIMLQRTFINPLLVLLDDIYYEVLENKMCYSMKIFRKER